MIWKNNPTLETINTINQNTLVDHLGIEFTEVGDDYIKAKMPVDHRTKQPMGLLHGGASAALSETMGKLDGESKCGNQKFMTMIITSYVSLN